MLVVDDEEPIRRILVRWIQKWGLEVTAVDSADAAVVEMTRTPADIIITDIMMPIHDGVWLLEQIRERWPKTIVIMESGAQDPSMVLRVKQHGAVDYLPKPFGREMVYQALERAVARLTLDKI